jgi:hypothetical protein
MPVTMPRLLALIAALLLSMSACGSDQGSAQDPTDDPSSGEPTSPEFTYDVVVLVSGSAAHGPSEKGARPALLSDEAALAQYAEQFQGPLPASLKSQGGQALSDLAPGQALTATVVAVGCEPPTQVRATNAGGTVSIAAVPVESNIQCLVPVTTVALVSMPEEYAQGFRQDFGAE